MLVPVLMVENASRGLSVGLGDEPRNGAKRTSFMNAN
jgi:hypothetical protein